MNLKMSVSLVLTILLFCVNKVVLQGTGSGNNGNLRLCIVEGRGIYKRGSKFCPILDKENSGIECVIGVDRLDCLRRIHKGTVDFGVFSPEDLIAAQWYNVEVLVVNELRTKQRPFARSIVAVANNKIFRDKPASLTDVLRNTSLCHPANNDDLKPLSETVVRYLESLVVERKCDPELSLEENRINATAAFFNKACMAGLWVRDANRDAELKRKYPSLCAACAATCSNSDHYWGASGALNCLTDRAGDVTWGFKDDVVKYFAMFGALLQDQKSLFFNQYSFLCKDGTSQSLKTKEPCAWVYQPWNVIVAKRKAAEAVAKLTSSLTNNTVVVDGHWHGALANLLKIHQALPPPLDPPQNPRDYLSSAPGFTEAYSQHACNPPRHITICTRNLLENNKCEWLGEAGSVHGEMPPLQCVLRNSTEECMAAVRDGQADVVTADSDWLMVAQREFSLTPILHEATPIINDIPTVSAYVRKDSGINKISDLRNKRAFFPSFDGVAWHAVTRYLSKNQKEKCSDIANTFFSNICAPGIENLNVTEKKKGQYTKTCYKQGERIVNGEAQALRSLVEGKSDVAFISRSTYNLYRSKHFQEPWAKDLTELTPVCPDENTKYCFISWTNLGHVFVSSNITAMRKQEVENVLTSFDHLFGNYAHELMFSMYGPFNHHLDVLFHNSTKMLSNDLSYFTSHRPFSQMPLNFELSVMNDTKVCQFTDFTTGFSVKIAPFVILIWSLVFSLILLN